MSTLRTRLLDLREQAIAAAERGEQVVLSPEETQEILNAALAGEMGEGLAAVALGKIAAMAGRFKDPNDHLFAVATLQKIAELARDRYNPEDHSGYAVLPLDSRVQ